MANVKQNHILFPTIVNEFEYIANENLLNAIRTEELYPPSNNLSSRSSDCNLQKRKEYEPLVDKILNTTKEVCKIYEYEYESEYVYEYESEYDTVLGSTPARNRDS